MSLTQENTKEISVQIINAFIKNNEGGNPAGVVLDADNLNEDEKLDIARKVGLSETAYVSQSKTEGFKLDFFTPTKRIAHCGHATIATFSYLASLNRINDGETSKETVDGPRKIILENGMAYMEQLAPSYRSVTDWQQDGVSLDDVLQSLSLNTDNLDNSVDPVLVNTGNNFIVLSVSSAKILKNIQPDFTRISEISERLDLIGYYIFTTDTDTPDIDATSRMFAPRYGIEEEAATGMAAGPLACVLYDFANIKKDTFQVGQGDFMPIPSPSLIAVQLELKENQISGLMAGGKGKVMKNIQIKL